MSEDFDRLKARKDMLVARERDAIRGQPDAILSPTPDELCPHVEMGADMVGGFVFDAESPKVSVGMCAMCLAICQAEFITAQPFHLYRKIL